MVQAILSLGKEWCGESSDMILIKRNILTLLGIDAQSFSMYTGYFYHWIEHYTVVGIVGRYETMISAALPLAWLVGGGDSL